MVQRTDEQVIEMKDDCDYFMEKVTNIKFRQELIPWTPTEHLCLMLQHRNIYDLVSESFVQENGINQTILKHVVTLWCQRHEDHWISDHQSISVTQIQQLRVDTAQHFGLIDDDRKSEEQIRDSTSDETSKKMKSTTTKKKNVPKKVKKQLITDHSQQMVHLAESKELTIMRIHSNKSVADVKGKSATAEDYIIKVSIDG